MNANHAWKLQKIETCHLKFIIHLCRLSAWKMFWMVKSLCNVCPDAAFTSSACILQLYWFSDIRKLSHFLISENDFLISENKYLISENNREFLISENGHDFWYQKFVYFLISEICVFSDMRNHFVILCCRKSAFKSYLALHTISSFLSFSNPCFPDLSKCWSPTFLNKAWWCISDLGEHGFR